MSIILTPEARYLCRWDSHYTSRSSATQPGSKRRERPCGNSCLDRAFNSTEPRTFDQPWRLYRLQNCCPPNASRDPTQARHTDPRRPSGQAPNFSSPRAGIGCAHLGAWRLATQSAAQADDSPTISRHFHARHRTYRGLMRPVDYATRDTIGHHLTVASYRPLHLIEEIVR